MDEEKESFHIIRAIPIEGKHRRCRATLALSPCVAGRPPGGQVVAAERSKPSIYERQAGRPAWRERGREGEKVRLGGERWDCVHVCVRAHSASRLNRSIAVVKCAPAVALSISVSPLEPPPVGILKEPLTNRKSQSECGAPYKRGMSIRQTGSKAAERACDIIFNCDMQTVCVREGDRFNRAYGRQDTYQSMAHVVDIFAVKLRAVSEEHLASPALGPLDKSPAEF